MDILSKWSWDKHFESRFESSSVAKVKYKCNWLFDICTDEDSNLESKRLFILTLSVLRKMSLL